MTTLDKSNTCSTDDKSNQLLAATLILTLHVIKRQKELQKIRWKKMLCEAVRLFSHLQKIKTIVHT